jgi:transcriptional regulator with XRE-family HTH domain
MAVSSTRMVATDGRSSPTLTLAALRRAMRKTQGEVATETGMHQGEISRVERRKDVLLSTLQMYAEALGARCEVAFVLPGGQRVVIAEPQVMLARRGPKRPYYVPF